MPQSELPVEKGTRVDGISKSGKIQVSYGVELTKNGKNVVNQFINPLYKEEISNEKERVEKKIKNKKSLEDD